ncbi:alpha/beta-hydrolase [Auriscalpium vulgare]|uniref:Alpha/beta-hydrolase n=1 Tax=Auriscalpium vulgare TaxID=40419 RepID=A0ACB8RBQ6_9AGAM|nr:alpha/beta-hydrolase [Auriscalpium vulgare]
MSNLFPSLETFAKGSAATAAGLSTIGMGLLYYGQNFLIYPSAFPQGSRENVPVPTDFSLPYSDVTLTTADNVKVKAYLLTQRPKLHINGETRIEWDDDEDGDAEEFAATRPTVLMFHGNGGNHGHRIPLAKVFYLKMRCNVLMLSYRGYGLSEGTPSEKGLQMDAQTALDYVLAHEYLSRTPIILYGQSIGGAVAIHLASQNRQIITALVLENTFMSLPRLIPTALPWLGPFSFLCHQKWESYLKVPKIPKEIPILMLGGMQDEVVPRVHMQELWALVRNRGREPSAEKPSDSSESSLASIKAIAAGRASAASSPTKASAPGEPRKDIKAGGVHEPHAGERGTPHKEVDGDNIYLEFPEGTHNDTCVQPGYWTAVAEFVANLSPDKRGDH